MGMYIEIALFSLLLGAIVGIISVPLIYFIKGRRKYGRKHGYKGKEITYPTADSSVLNVERVEHSAKDY